MKRIIALLTILLSFVISYAQNEALVDSLKNKLDQDIQINDTSAIFFSCYELGKYYFKTEKYNESFSYYSEALNYAKSEEIVKTYNKLGSVCWVKGEFEEARAYYTKGLTFSEEIGEMKFRPMVLNNIGMIYAEFDQSDKALEYYKKSLDIRIINKDKKEIGKSYNSIGREYFAQDSLETALIYLNKALDVFREVKLKMNESNALNNIGNVYLRKNNLHLAMKYHQSAYKIRKEIKHNYLITESHKNLAKVYIQSGDYVNAEKIINEGIKHTKITGSPKHLKLFYYQFYDLYSRKGNYKKALNNYLKFSELKDSINSVESENKIAEMEIQYQIEKKEQQIEFLNTKDQLNSEIIAKQEANQLLLIAGISILLISLIIVLIIYLQRNRAYKMLVKKSIEIDDLEEEKGNKASNQKISNEQQIINDLLSIIEENKYFLNPTCTIDSLAKKIETNRQYLSVIINDKFDSNFNQFINTYRIKEARKLLLDREYDKYTIDTIAKLSGFKTKATFNSAFKKMTGVTPSFFKKEHFHYTA